MSAGIRSGVNCTRFSSRPSTRPSVVASFVLARPGAPTSRAWPPPRMADQHLFDHLVLAEDDLADGVAHLGQALADGLEFGDDVSVCFVDAGHERSL